MNKKFLFKVIVGMMVSVLALTGCFNSKESSKNEEKAAVETVTEAKTIEITDVHGKVVVPVNPKRVIALDNRTFETLSD